MKKNSCEVGNKMRHKICGLRTNVFYIIVLLNLFILCFIYLSQNNSDILKNIFEFVNENRSTSKIIDKSREISDDVKSKYPKGWEDELIRVAEEAKEEIYAMPLRVNPVPLNEVLLPGQIDMTKYDPKETIYFIPPVPRVSVSDTVFRIAKNVTAKYKKLEKKKIYKEKIVILTPIHNSQHSLQRYMEQLLNLDYPRKLMSVVFGEDSSADETLHTAHDIVEELKNIGFARAEVFHFNISGQIQGNWGEVHNVFNQYKRRKHLAKARNLLLKAGLRDEQYVLWIDSDIRLLPTDLIQQLLWPQKDVVAPLCLFSTSGRTRNYDKNTWRETELSLREQKKLGKTDFIVEGYSPTSRLYLSDLRGEGRNVQIDGVGGCSLLIRAECHRKGLNFPEEIYQHHIETEGLAKLAKSMGFGVYGVPFVEVFHS